MTIIELKLLKEQISADSIKQLLILMTQIDNDKTTSVHVSADLSAFEICWQGLVDKRVNYRPAVIKLSVLSCIRRYLVSQGALR